MKAMKRTLAFFLCVVMTIAMGITAFADDVAVSTDDTGDSGSTGSTVTVTIPEDLKDHTFEAYQIFTGTQAEDDKTLTDVEWGNGIDYEYFLADLQSDTSLVDADGANIFKDCETAADVANVLGTVADDSATAETVAKIAYDARLAENAIPVSSETTELASGYYLIVDTTDMQGKDDTVNASLLQVTQNITIKSKKLDKPTLEKKVGSAGDSKLESSASFSIGDWVRFTLIGTVPNDWSEYANYKYTFYDTLAEGFDFDEENIEYIVSVQLFDGEGKILDAGDYCEIGWDEESRTLSVQPRWRVILEQIESAGKDTERVAGCEMHVTYDVRLNSNAVIGGKGNVNTAYLKYYNDPNNCDELSKESFGQTAEAKAVVYTYQLDATKVDANDTSTVLPNAKFRLYKNGSYAVFDNTGEFCGFVYTGDMEKLESDIYSTESKQQLLKDLGFPEDITPENITFDVTTGADGNFSVKGLGAGTYSLEEVEAPKGYNKLTKPIELKITDTMEATALTGLSITAGDEKAQAGDPTTGIVSITVKNNKGAILPETGGMGTTIFYVVGGLMMAGAAVLLITRKRMGTNS